MTVVFQVIGDPVGKQRPKTAMRGNHVHAYTPEKTRNYEAQIAAEYRRQVGGIRFPEGTALAIAVYAYLSIPKSVGKAERERMIQGESLPRKKPDFDNIAKTVCDALNGLAYDDDKQIVEAHIYKRYADLPRISVQIREAARKS